jgi:hypothetical protein
VLLLQLPNRHRPQTATATLLPSYLPPLFCFLITVCFLPLPQLFALATTPATATMFASAEAATMALTAVITNAAATAIALSFNVAAILTRHQEVS